MLKTVKRVLSDLKENHENQIDGIKLYLPNKKNDDSDDNPKNLLTLHCDINIKHGIFQDITVHTILHIPDKYPYSAPAMNIAPDFDFTHEHHEHVLGKSICNDMLSNFAWFFESADKAKVASGWSTGYTINVILSQMQIFFADPDLPSLPSAQSVEKLRAFASKYKCAECSQKRTYADLVKGSDEEMSEKMAPLSINSEESEKKAAAELEELKKRLICGITKMDFRTKGIILGYPLFMEIDKFNRLWPKIVLESISYDAYMEQVQNEGIIKLDNFKAITMYSANGDMYNYWIPFYVNEEHFQRSVEHVKNSISVIRSGIINGVREHDFRPDMVFDVLPCLMNKTIVHIMNGTLFHSAAAIQAYCNFLRLYLRLMKMFSLKEKLNKKVGLFVNNAEERNKKKTGDLGEFIVNLFLSDFSYLKDEKVKSALLSEFFARQIFWIEKNTNCRLESYPTVEKKLEAAFNASKTSNYLLVFNIEMAKWFITDIEKKIDLIDARLGFIPEHIVTAFQDRVAQIKKIPDYRVLMQAIEYSHVVNSPEKMAALLDKSKKQAISLGYIR